MVKGPDESCDQGAPVALVPVWKDAVRGAWSREEEGQCTLLLSSDRRIQMAVVVSTCLLYRVLGSKGVLYLRRGPETC